MKKADGGPRSNKVQFEDHLWIVLADCQAKINAIGIIYPEFAADIHGFNRYLLKTMKKFSSVCLQASASRPVVPREGLTSMKNEQKATKSKKPFNVDEELAKAQQESVAMPKSIIKNFISRCPCKLVELPEGLQIARCPLHSAAEALLEAAKAAQCDCTISQRDSGHAVGCWMPDLLEAISKASGQSR